MIAEKFCQGLRWICNFFGIDRHEDFQKPVIFSTSSNQFAIELLQGKSYWFCWNWFSSCFPLSYKEITCWLNFKRYSQGKAVFCCIQYKNGCLALSDLSGMFTQSSEFYTLHYRLLKSTYVWKNVLHQIGSKMNVAPISKFYGKI